MHRGQFGLDNQPSSRINLKSYPTQYFPRLAQELDVYAALAPLAVIVPRLYTVLAPLNLAWAGLVLEDAGTELGNSSQSWDEVDLTPEDRSVPPYLFFDARPHSMSCPGAGCMEL